VPMKGSMSEKRNVLILLAAVTVALAACNEGTTDGGPPVDPRDAVLQAMSSAYEVGTMHEEFRFEMSAAGETFTFTGEGDVDNDRQEAEMSMDMGALGGSMDVIMVDGIFYMRSPMFAGAGMPTEWVSMDPAKMDAATAAQFGGGFGGTTDPSAYVGLFAGVVDVRQAGQDTIAGVDTNRYEGTIDLEEVLRRFPEVVGQDLDPNARRQLERGLEQALEQFETLGVDGRIPFEIWIDGEGLPRRQVISMDFSGLVPGDEEASMRMQVDFSAFGEPVDIEPPAKRDVTDITRLMDDMEGAGAASTAA
jgi:hypothetical protein